jgi:hypothetical protein
MPSGGGEQEATRGSTRSIERQKKKQRLLARGKESTMKTKTLPKGAVACALAVMLASPTNLAIAHEITAGQTDGMEPVTVVGETNVDAQNEIEPVTDTDEAIVEAQDVIEHTEQHVCHCGSATTATTDTSEAYVFFDVTPTMAHYEDVVWVGANRISEGALSAGGRRAFVPFAMTTRLQAAEFLFNLAQHWGVVDANWQPTKAQKRAFVDVSDSTPYARAIRWLASTGISEGWKLSNGKYEFRPDAQVARCDMAAFLFRMATRYGKASATWQPTTAQKKAFTDVNNKTPHAREVYWCAATGISEGWKLSNGKYEFRPYETTRRIDYATCVHRLDSI